MKSIIGVLTHENSIKTAIYKIYSTNLLFKTEAIRGIDKNENASGNRLRPREIHPKNALEISPQRNSKNDQSNYEVKL